MGILATAVIVILAALSLISAVVFGFLRNHFTPALVSSTPNTNRPLRRR